jgi:glycerate-2-kinase
MREDEKTGDLGYSQDVNGKRVESRELNVAADSIARAAVEAVEPGRLVRENVTLVRADGRDVAVIRERPFDLGDFDRVFLIAFGKAAPAMAGALAAILGKRLTRGLVVSPEGGAKKGEGALEFVKGSHPLPDEGSLEGARKALDLAEGAGERDLVFVCISGGGSALLCHPARGITLEEKRWVTQTLLKAGADIGELNTVRKHLSAVKGGHLAKAAWPATVVSLVLSDVLENDLETIASGPTHWDSTTFGDAKNVLEGFGFWENVPLSVREHIGKGILGERPETAKAGEPVFGRVHTFIVGDNMAALEAARAEADRLGFEPLILTASDKGEARRAAANYAAFLANMACSVQSAPKPFCFLAGGELTVTVKGRGSGGRNTEFVLASLVEFGKEYLEEIFGESCGDSGLDWLILSLGTDGIDGPTDAAGAWADPSTLAKGRELDLDPAAYLSDNDSYGFFQKTGGLILTGPTGTNVMDVRIFLLGPA